ncbi:MAG: MBL fold metallo-hydrolase [Lachnospiraceae bacterium]|nr:MBL fold metallo-hydrolase [Lachnospiraceae bacterium]
MSRKMKALLMIVIIIIVLVAVVISFLATPRFGRTPRDSKTPLEIIERIEASPHYRDGRFHNFDARSVRLGGDSPHRFFEKVEGLRPESKLPSIEIDLFKIEADEDILVWLGHSALYIRTGGVSFLVDPSLLTGSPIWFINQPFLGSDVFKPNDIPKIDYLLISHDHFDHLDYDTINALRDRIGKVVCGLGTGEHFRRWNFAEEDIIELDWNESAVLKGDITLHILPARHYSGRISFGSDKTLWVSFMIAAPSLNIYLSGDTSYGSHFKQIGEKFDIDLAIIEFGQYNEAWRDSHIMPDDIGNVISDLNPKRAFMTHHAKYALAKHHWNEPLEIVSKLNEQEGFDIITPMMGELVYLDDLSQEFSKWWVGIK